MALNLRRNPGFWQRLDIASRMTFPAASILFGILLLGLPTILPMQGALRPAFVLVSVFFWSLYRPSSLPAPVLALLGLCLDLVGVSPLGVWPVILLLLHALVVQSRRLLVSQGFFMVWLAFIVIAAAACWADWAVQSLLTLRLLPIDASLFQWAVTIGLYPLLAAGLIRAHRGAAAPELA
jgi:rod shape-determining protein MreD